MHQHAFLVSLLPLVAAHGFLASPPARRPGSAYRATCGEQPFYQQSADINGNVQGIQQVTGSDKTAACNLWLCKGFLYEDNTSNVQTYSLGQTIDIRATIAAPHTGYANVSVVKTSTNSMIGTPLIEFQNYASNAGVAANNTAFSVTLPDSLGGECTTPGDCVLQWFWDAPDIDQTYESCVDFVVSGGSSGPAPSSSAAASSAAATSTATTSAQTSVETAAPTVTSATAVTSTSTDAAPATTTTAAPGSGDDECPADDGEDDGDDEGDDEEECPADGEDDDEGDDEECPADDGEGDDEECPADDGEGDDEPTVTTSFGAKDLSTTAAGTVPPTSIVTLVLTSTVTTERVVTVTAAPTACN
jgi:predicted carbohydrate-binding protein with CBM5 and CBM33 domain